MRTTSVLLAMLALTLPDVAMPHPCEGEIAQMRKDLEAIRGAIATIEALPPGDTQRQALSGARGKYDLEQRRTKEAQARCERLVREESPGASPRAVAPTPVQPGPAPAQAAAPAAAVLAAPAAASALPTTPGFTGCGKDTDCKGDRICVKGACQDPPSR